MNLKDTIAYRKMANEFFGIDIAARTRQAKYIEARQMWFHWIRFAKGFTLTETARTLPPDRHHSSVVNALKRHDDQHHYDKIYRAKYDAFVRLMETNPCTVAELVNRELTIHFPQYRLPSFVIESLNKII